jgi:hypothetical protein
MPWLTGVTLTPSALVRCAAACWLVVGMMLSSAPTDAKRLPVVKVGSFVVDDIDTGAKRRVVIEVEGRCREGTRAARARIGKKHKALKVVVACAGLTRRPAPKGTRRVVSKDIEGGGHLSAGRERLRGGQRVVVVEAEIGFEHTRQQLAVIGSRAGAPVVLHAAESFWMADGYWFSADLKRSADDAAFLVERGVSGDGNGRTTVTERELTWDPVTKALVAKPGALYGLIFAVIDDEGPSTVVNVACAPEAESAGRALLAGSSLYALDQFALAAKDPALKGKVARAVVLPDEEVLRKGLVQAQGCAAGARLVRLQ